MNSIDVPMSSVYEKQQTANNTAVSTSTPTTTTASAATTSAGIKCGKFSGNELQTQQDNAMDMTHDDSSDSSCGLQDENLRNSESSIDTLVMVGESMAQRVAPSVSSSSCASTAPYNNNNTFNTNAATSLLQTSSLPNANTATLLNGVTNTCANTTTMHYTTNTLLSGTVTGNPTLTTVAFTNQKPQNTSHKTKREWRVVGWFTSDAAMNEVRKREKVSKRKSVAQINGTKVFYRCNNWRRTNCNFRMYALYHAPDQITLYASGEHDHTTKNPHYVPRNYTGNMLYNLAPCSSQQQQAFDQIVIQATNPRITVTNPGSIQQNKPPDMRNAIKNDHRTQSSSDLPPYLDSLIKVTEMERNACETVDENGIDEFQSFNLSDGGNIAQLLQLANQINHTFTFTSKRNSEYCFESNAERGRIIAFSDLGDFITVTERYDGVEKSCEHWKKADWNQFVWAVRGRCSNA